MEKKFHEILKEARLNAGLTQSQLAEKIGVAKSTYCNWGQGTREPNVLKLKAIAKALGVTGDYLLRIWSVTTAKRIDDSIRLNAE